MIGGFVDFTKETDEDGVSLLVGEARIYKRFPKTCEALAELYESGNLKFSCEVMVKKYKEVNEDGVRVVDYNNGNNFLFGNCIVTDPAEEKAVATVLIAEALNKDLKSQEQGGTKVVSEIEFNKGYEIKYHGELELNSLKFSEVSNQVYNKLNPIDAKRGSRSYNYMVRDLYTDYVIAEDWDDEALYKIPYTISNDEVALAAQDQWVKGRLGFIPDGVEVSELQKAVDELNEKITQLNEEVKNVKTVEELQAELSAKETELNSLKDQVKGLEASVAELNSTIVGQEEAKKGLEASIAELNEKIGELEPFKLQVEASEKAEKVAELSSKFAKVLDEETFKSEKVQDAIKELNEAELNSIVVSELAKQKAEVETELNNKSADTVIPARKEKDLLPEDVSSKYGLTI
jgi:phage shock protein A